MARAEYPEYTRERALSNVLAQREPAIIVSDGVLRVWLQKYKASDSVTVSSMAELHQGYGDVVKALAIKKTTPYQLHRAPRVTQSPSILISHGIAKEWLTKKSMHN